MIRRVWDRVVDAYEDFVCGVENVIRWAPVVWNDYDFDWEPLARVMEYKLRRMAEHHARAQFVQDWETVVSETTRCADAIARLRADEYAWDGIDMERHPFRQADEDDALVGALIRRMRTWWD